MDLSEYRQRASKYLAERSEELYRYASGHKATLDLAPIYEKYVSSLFADQIVDTMMNLYKNSSSEETRTLRKLLKFTVEHNLSHKVRSLDEQMAKSANNDDVQTLEMTIANTEEREDRRRLYGELQKRMENIHRLRIERLAVYESSGRQVLGSSYDDLYGELNELDLDMLRAQLDNFLQASRDYYYGQLRRFSELVLGLKSVEVMPWDVARLLRGSPYDYLFEDGKAMSLAKRTLMGLGIDLKKMNNIVIDAEERPRKSAVAQCIRVHVPEKVYLVMRPQGGLVDILTLFHEIGRALHAACVKEDVSFEDRYLGDAAVSRTMGFLFQYIVLNHEWLADYLKVQCSEELRSFTQFKKLYSLRREAVRFLSALDYFRTDKPSEKDLLQRVTESMTDVLGHPVDEDFALSGFDRPLSETDFLRGWIFEAELREILVNRFGPRWYSRPGAGDFLKELWRFGERFSVEELAARVRFVELNMGPITRELA